MVKWMRLLRKLTKPSLRSVGRQTVIAIKCCFKQYLFGRLKGTRRVVVPHLKLANQILIPVQRKWTKQELCVCAVVTV